MNASLSRYAPYIYALLRIVVGVLFALHGSQKLLGFPGDKPTVELASHMGVAGIIELVGGLLVAVGLFARVAAFLASGEMAVAYFMAHVPQHPLPLLNSGEPAVLFCFVFLYIFFQGPGPWSLDSLRHRAGTA
ncbi:DoxX family protein [Hymenobacter busanensis]|uniref:DoxX family protein n=1 Tax=Hymenobacter busanensis TaxID=2607656 RepID=A0A7L5A117_9BACT|nr:DoxX family protein [Hymenobacter busanensis]KAA9338334.1 DoxX family protein [Hymenobacter busanensis]QHJ09241.1 DoxX family membrane protein [Hymenobacter busanensis]